MLALQETPVDLSCSSLSIESQLQELTLYQCEIDVNCNSLELARLFEENVVLPGVILRNNGTFYGMFSRRRFLEILSRRYGPELFLKRPIHMMYSYACTDVLILPGDTKIVDAIQPSLDRSPELLYEPIVVRLADTEERLLDVHHLLLSHTRIHELMTKLLHEQTRSKLLQTEKMASLGQMVAGVAHEILNPVNFICGNLEYLSDYGNDLLSVLQAYETEFPDAPNIDALKEDVEFDFLIQDFPKILSSMAIGAERLRKIISALRSFSHMDEATKRPLDTHQCLDNTLLILNSRIKNFIIIAKDYGQLPPVNCFSGQVSQVFTNLIGNAIDALTDYSETNTNPDWKPQITIKTQLLPQTSSHYRQRISVAIQDTGPGIPAEIQTKIFETFFTTKPVGKGTGFGLAIARQIVVEKHGGELILESLPGSGTTFTVILPLS